MMPTKRYHTDLLSCSIAAYVIPLGYSNQKGRNGYAHLFEHMVIRANARYLQKLEHMNVVFNASTADDHIIFMFVDYGNKTTLREYDSGHLAAIFNADFLEDDLAIERSTITQELLYRQNEPLYYDVNEKLGTIADIESFDLTVLNELKSHFLKSAVGIISSSTLERESSTSLSDIAIAASKSSDYILSGKKQISLSMSEGDLEINFLKDADFELLIHMIRILYLRIGDKRGLRICRNDDNVSIIVNDTRLSFLERLAQAKLYRDQYILQLCSMRFYLDEIPYVASYLS